MKQTLLIITALIMSFFINGCASFSSSMLNPPDNPLPIKMKSLDIGLAEENVYRDAGFKSTTVQTHYTTIFDRTIGKNICEQSRKKWGYIDLKIVHSDNNMRSLINIPIITLYIFPGFFFPMAANAPIKSSIEMEVEISIYDSQREQIKKYIINDSIDGWIRLKYPTVPNAFNSNPASFHNLSVKLFHQIMREFEKRVSGDIVYINAELEKAGLINK